MMKDMCGINYSALSGLHHFSIRHVAPFSNSQGYTLCW